MNHKVELLQRALILKLKSQIESIESDKAKLKKKIDRIACHNTKLHEDIEKLISEHTQNDSVDDEDDEYNPLHELNEMSEDETDESVISSFYQSKIYEDYSKIKLLSKAKVHNNRLQAVNDVMTSFISKRYNLPISTIFQHTNRRTADRLTKYRLYDICMVEIAYGLQFFFGPKSVFDIYHDEGTDCAVPFLFTSIGYNPDFVSDCGMYVPKLIKGYICKLISASELSDKTAKSSVHQGIIPSLHYLNYVGYKLYDDWRDVISLMRRHTNCMSDENTTAMATSLLLFKELGVQHYALWICFMHQLSNSIKPSLKWLIWARTQSWNVTEGEPPIARSKNISIIELGDKASAYFKSNSSNERAKPNLLKALIDDKSTDLKLKQFKRSVGERTINKFVNNERLLERREAMKLASSLYDKNTGSIISDNILFYEYSCNSAWFRETIVSIAFDRSIAGPLLTMLNTTFDTMKVAFEKITILNQRLKQIVAIKEHETKELLLLFVGFTAITPLTPYYKTSKYLSIIDRRLIIFITISHLRLGDASESIMFTSWEQNPSQINDFMDKHHQTILFSRDVFYRTVWKLKVRDLKICLFMFRHCLEQLQLDLEKRLKAQGQGTDPDQNEYTKSNNDISERAVGCKKQIKSIKAHISNQSNENECMATLNDPFETFDGIDALDPSEFARMLNVLHHLGSYREKELAMKIRQEAIENKRNEKALRTIHNAEAKTNICNSKHMKEKEIKPIVQALSPIQNTIWSNYLDTKQAIATQYQFQGRNEWKKQLKSAIIQILIAQCGNSSFKFKQAMSKWSADKLQANLYGFCCKQKKN
eukprot:849381_1